MIKYIFLKVHPTIKNIAKEIRGGESVITDTRLTPWKHLNNNLHSYDTFVTTSSGYAICHSPWKECFLHLCMLLKETDIKTLYNS